MKRPSSSRLFGGVLALALIALLAGAVLLQYSIDNAAGSKTQQERSSPSQAGRSLLDLLGGVRESIAAYFWIKTDAIHHEYYGGDITKEQALYPYYWMITRLDPHFTMAYFYASYMLCRFGEVKPGFDLALEGVRYNPDSPLMQYNLAEIYFFFEKDPAKARYYLLKAIQLTNDEQDKIVWGNLLNTIDEVLAGKRKQPVVGSIKQAAGLDKKLDKYEQQHEHGAAR